LQAQARARTRLRRLLGCAHARLGAGQSRALPQRRRQRLRPRPSPHAATKAFLLARAAGALTIGAANNPDSPVVALAEIGVTLDTGSETISGSTRLKAGTAQKIFLNTLSSAIMVRLHKVYGNLMVDVMPTNAKLYRRAIALTVRATGASETEAKAALEACAYKVKTAIVALRLKTDVAAAQTALDAVAGDVRRAINRS
jgi:N-acetylmuramic acid 6-phosphate etherase